MCGPHPGPGLISGWQQPGEQKVCLSAPAALPPPQPQPGTPLRGSSGCQGLTLPVAMAPAGDETGGWLRGAGFREGSGGMVEAWSSAAAEAPRPSVNSGRGAGASAGAGLDPERSRPVAELTTQLA